MFRGQSGDIHIFADEWNVPDIFEAHPYQVTKNNPNILRLQWSAPSWKPVDDYLFNISARLQPDNHIEADICVGYLNFQFKPYRRWVEIPCSLKFQSTVLCQLSQRQSPSHENKNYTGYFKYIYYHSFLNLFVSFHPSTRTFRIP